MNPTLFTNPYLMVAFAGLSIYGTMSAGKAEQNRAEQHCGTTGAKRKV